MGALRETISWTDEEAGGNLWRVLGLRRFHMQVRIGEPIPTAGRNRKELTQLAHASVSALGEAGRLEAAS